jgi:hypothetical protein
MAWLEILEDSWNGADTRPELDGLAVMFWARRRTTNTKGSGRPCCYQEVQDDEASPMAKQGSALVRRQFLVGVLAMDSKIRSQTNSTLWCTNKIEPVSERCTRSR